MTNFEIRVNPRGQKKWISPLGKLVINFGTLDYLITLCFQKINANSYVPKNDFEDKVNSIIKKLGKININQGDKKALRKALKKSIKLYGFRNLIIHSPIIGISHKDQIDDLILAVDSKKKKLINLEDLIKNINSIVETTEEISLYADKIWGLKSLYDV